MTPTFKSVIRSDIDTVFMNLDEFAGMHIVNGKKMPVTVDNNELIERQKKTKSNMDGVFVRSLLIYVKAKDYGALPAIGSVINLDGTLFHVTDATNEDGLYSIEMEANKA